MKLTSMRSSEMRRDSQIRTYDRAKSVVFLKTNEKFGGLSNMAGGFPLQVNGLRIYSSEALYQACRFPHRPDVQRLIISQPSPMTAKMKSKPYRHDTRRDWEQVRVKVMRWCLRVKLAQNWDRFSRLLLETGDHPIVEESRKDDFWGAKSIGDQTLVGMNVLGRLLMELREAVKAGDKDSLRRVEPLDIPDFMLGGHPVQPVYSSSLAEVTTRPKEHHPSADPAETQPSLFDQAAVKEPSGPFSLSISAFAARKGRFKPYPDYRDSGFEWLGEIPSHWKVRRLKYLSRMNPESLPEDTDPTLEMNYVDIGGVSSLGRIVESERLTFASAPSRARRIVRDGDVIVSTVRTYLRAIAAISNPEPGMVVSTGFAVVRPEDGLTTHYAAYALRAPYFVERVVANSKGVSFPAINESEMATYELAVPPEPEQHAIVDFLDRETSKIDALLTKKERMIELLQEKRAALITQAVTKGLDPTAPMKDSGIEWLGRIPAHWEAKRLAHLTPPDRRIMYGIVLPGPHVDDGVPIVKGGDVSPERLRLDRLKRTAREIESGYARSRLRGGDLVYAIRGSIGEVAMVPDELEGANLTQDAARISYTAATYGPWLMYTLKSTAIFAQLEAGALGATVRGINIRDLKRASLAVPPLFEQRAIADFLDRETMKIDAFIRKVREGIERLKEYRSALISAAVTGKIDVRGC